MNVNKFEELNDRILLKVKMKLMPKITLLFVLSIFLSIFACLGFLTDLRTAFISATICTAIESTIYIATQEISKGKKAAIRCISDVIVCITIFALTHSATVAIAAVVLHIVLRTVFFIVFIFSYGATIVRDEISKIEKDLEAQKPKKDKLELRVEI